MSDRQIAVHEAGHALVAHVLGEVIREVDMCVDDDQDLKGATVRLREPVQHRSTALGGMYAELHAGFPLYSGKANKDAHLGSLLPEDDYSARSILANNEGAFSDLSRWFEVARTAREVLAGDDVHAFQTSRGVPFAEAVKTQTDYARHSAACARRLSSPPHAERRSRPRCYRAGHGCVRAVTVAM